MLPPYARVPHPTLALVDLVVTNGLRALVGSLRYSIEELRLVLRDQLGELLGEDLADKIIEKYLVFEALNPYGMSVEELIMEAMELVERHDPGVFVVHGLEMLAPIMMSDPYRCYDLLVNILFHLKSAGKIVVGIMSSVYREQFLAFSSLVDLVIRISVRKTREGFEPYVYVWRKGKMPATLRLRDALGDVKKVFPKYAGRFRELVEKPPASN